MILAAANAIPDVTEPSIPKNLNERVLQCALFFYQQDEAPENPATFELLSENGKNGPHSCIRFILSPTLRLPPPRAVFLNKISKQPRL